MSALKRFLAQCIRLGLWLRERFQRILIPSDDPRRGQVTASHDALFSTLLEHASDFITILNANGTIVYESPAVMKLLGYDRAELVGEAVFKFVHPDDLPEVFRVFRIGVQTPGYSAHLQCRFRHKNGSWRLLDITGKNLLDDPTVNGIVVNSIDITERAHAQRERMMMSNALESIREGVIIANLEDIILFANKGAQTLYGYELNEMLGKHISMLRSGKNPPDVVAHIYPETMKGGWRGELINVKKDGTEFPVAVSTGLIRDETGNAIALIGVATDMSEQKQAEGEMRKTLSLLTATLESTADGILVVDKFGHIVSYNHQFAHMWRIPMGILESRRDDEALRYVVDQLSDPQEFIAKVQELYSRPEAESFDIIGFKDGRIFERLSKPQRIGGKSVGRVWSFRDVTERKKAEAAREKSEQQFRSLFEESKDAIYVSTPEGRFVDINPAGVALFGYDSKEELVKIDIKKDLFIDPAKRSEYGKELESRGFVKDYQLELRRKDGQTIVVLETASALKDETGKVIAYRGIMHDVTEDKRLEENLRQSEERYRQFFEDDLTGDFISTPAGRIIECNREFAKIFGYNSIEEVLKTSASSFYPNPEVREAFLNLLRERKRLENYEMEARRRDGKPVYVIENVIGVFDQQGTLTGLKGYLFDVTERKRLEEELRQSQKMEGIGTLAGGIAHDFNNILSIIMVSASRFKQDGAGNKDDLIKVAETILSAVDRGAGLTRQLLTFARKTEIHFEPLEINEIIKDLVKLLRETFPRTITFSLQLADSLPLISADRNQVNQALLNLCVNARDAMPSGGSISIATSVVDRSRLSSAAADAKGSHFIDICVRDTGTGMDQQTRERIFEPFFTTKERGQGTGLGLAVVYGVVKSHNGLITVESTKGMGTIFHMFFPLASIKPGIALADVPESEVMPGGTERVLFVEDEEEIRVAMMRTLSGKGYGVVGAVDGEEAVATYEAEHQDIDLVVLDLGLPRLSGWDVLTRVQKKNPEAKVVIVSGYFDPNIQAKLKSAGIRYLVQKPYSPAKLLRTIREIMTV